MSLHLYLLHIKLSRLSILGWSLLLGTYAVLVVYLYPSINDATGLVDHLRQLPLQVRSTIGLTQEAIDEVFPEGTFSFYGALTVNYLTWWPVFLGIYAIIFGAGTVGRDMEQGILGTLLSQPLRRYKFLLSKSAAFISILILLWLTSWLAVIIAVVTIDIDASFTNIALAHGVGLLLVLAIFSYSVLISSLFPEPRNALVTAFLTTFIIYMLNFMSPSFGPADWLENGSLFHFYEPFDLLSNAEVNWAGIGVYLGIIVGAHMVSIMIFQRRDVRV